MKRFFLFLTVFLCFIVAYGCAESENSSVATQNSAGKESIMDNTDISSAEDFSNPVISDDVTSEDVTSDDVTSDHVTSDDITSDDETSDDVTSDDVTSDDVTSDDVTSEDTTSEDTTSDEEIYTDIGDAELLPSGYLIYNGAAYSGASYSKEVSQRYAQVYDEYARLFPNTGIHVIAHPLSIYNVKNPLVRAMLRDQGAVLDSLESDIYGRVNFVNLKEIFAQHRGEYLYFKSDFHWTQLGAYYAYCQWAESVGITPTPKEAFVLKTVTKEFHGRVNDYANDDRIAQFIDSVYAYMPRKQHTMTVYNQMGQKGRVYDNCIQTDIKNYSCFTVGDQPILHINVPQNDQNKKVLVIKESSGNAFVPFLVEHYGNIVVIDPRHALPDVRQIVNDYGIDDIIFFANAGTLRGDAYCNYYRSLIGY